MKAVSFYVLFFVHIRCVLEFQSQTEAVGVGLQME